MRRALERGCDRDIVMDVLDVSERSMFYKAKRAYAFDFPLDAFSRGGRPSTNSDDKETTAEPDRDDVDAQQSLDTVIDIDSDDTDRTETWGGVETGELVETDTAPLLSELVQDVESCESDADLDKMVAIQVEMVKDLQGRLE